MKNGVITAPFFKRKSMSKIVFKDRNAVLIYKPPGVSSQPDNTAGGDALTATSGELSSLGEKAELYPVHRLDKVVGGLLLFARNRRAAAELSALVSEGELNKEYLAVVDGAPSEGIYIDYLSKNSALGKATVYKEEKAGAKYSELECFVINTVKTEKGEKSLIKVILKTGRFHQIRAQLSSRDHPLLGDKKYGSKDLRCKTPALLAYKLTVPTDQGNKTFTHLPSPSEYPWSLFCEEVYREV